VHAVERAGRHHEHDVAFLRFRRDAICNRVNAVDLFDRNAVRGESLDDRRNRHHVIQSVSLFVASLVKNVTDDDAIGFAERIDVAALELFAR